MTEGPLARYRALVQTGELKPDPIQELAAEKLQSLAHALAGSDPHAGKRGWIARFGLNSRTEAPPPLGLYLYGAVGRPKHIHLNLVFERTPVTGKDRVHLHA